ncbi:hypothetical protein CCO03_18850 [Comamonas serinivorans]|uniref:Endonuclease/exonuclease/phosphatase domain-containing protein n=1 Tax=Comamonas serinivorans TaxID=1082851 RepID=A0A1Y0ES63_9BURK|nr:ExeM/NucH family extracellular endonuclease [Comamonas serinivorans]ARU06443.1 hypothetical protein CCO03_18850 [Comamonas serinivorans]
MTVCVSALRAPGDLSRPRGALPAVRGGLSAVAAALLLWGPAVQAATTLAAGDVALVSFNATPSDDFAFVVLRDLKAGTVIHFSDNGWTAGATFRPNEGYVDWTATVAVSAGQVVRISQADTSPTASTGTAVKRSSFNLANDDSLLAYQGADASPSFVYGVQNQASWNADATSSTTSSLPADLITGQTAVAAKPGGSSMAYTGPTTGSPAALRAAIATASNWAANASPPTAFTLGEGGGGTTPDPELAITPISRIQGRCDACSMAGQTVRIEGVVTAVLPGLKGFFVQTEDGQTDGDDATSEGLFVYAGTLPAGLAVGQLVRAQGAISEYRNLTEMTLNAAEFEIDVRTPAMPRPVTLTLPVEDVGVWERHEGMLVEVKAAGGQDLVVTDNYYLGRYGTLTLATEKQLQFTEAHAPDAAAYEAYLAQVLRAQIVLDDGVSAQNPGELPGRHGQPLSAGNTLRTGDTTPRIVGVLDQLVAGTEAANQTSYRVQPTEAVVFQGEARPTPESLAAELGSPDVKVVGANVLNLFTTLGSASFTTPLGNSMSGRGAEDEVERDRQLAKIVSTLVGMDADVYGLNEIQNNGFGADSALKMLVDAMNAKAGAGTYDYVKGPFQIGSGHTVAGAGTDAISVALVYNTRRVRPHGQAAAADVARYDAFNATYGSRVPVAQTFAPVGNDEAARQFTVVVNHFKSKGSVNDPDVGDGQGANNQARRRAAAQLATWLATNPTGAANTQTVLVGDFNAYAQEDPVKDLEASGFRKVSQGTSYLFQGLHGSLDHVFVSESLADRVGRVIKWRINADEPTVLDYNTNYKSAAQIAGYYSEAAYRSSDHNPVILGLSWRTPPDPEAGEDFELDTGGGAVQGNLAGGGATCRLDASPSSVSGPGSRPAGFTLPYGMLAFSASDCDEGGTVTLTLSYPDTLPAGAQYWKWGPTADNAEPHWFALPTQVEGRTARVTITDGGLGDGDLTRNGRVVDPGGIAVPLAVPGGTVAPVPSLAAWAQLALAGLLGGAAALRRRRRA